MALLEVLAPVTGWLSNVEAVWLNYHAAQVTEGCIVEIGSFQGKSTIALALNASVPVYAIDPHHAHTDEVGADFGPEDRTVFAANIAQAGVHNVWSLDRASDDVLKSWGAPIGLLFIDGAHNYEQVVRDVFGWLRYIVPGGLLVIHDRTWPDIERVLNTLDEYPYIQRYGLCDSIQAYRKLPCD